MEKTGLEIKERILTRQCIKEKMSPLVASLWMKSREKRPQTSECTGIPGQVKRGFQSIILTVVV